MLGTGRMMRPDRRHLFVIYVDPNIKAPPLGNASHQNRWDNVWSTVEALGFQLVILLPGGSSSGRVRPVP